MIRFTLKDSVLTARLNGKEIGSYHIGGESCVVDRSELAIRGYSEEEQVNDFLIYIKDEVKLDEIPSYVIECNAGHAWEESIFRFLGLKAHLRMYQSVGPLKVLKSQCPQCWFNQ